jgi:dsDNA-specific endonuclease/ATPase MutS2
MASSEYKKAEEELNRMEALHRRYDEVNDALLKDKDTLEELVKQTHNLYNQIIPALKQFIQSLIDCRMTVNREMQDILRNVVNLKKVSESNKPIDELCKSILVLNDLLTPEMRQLMEKLVSKD